MSDFSAQSQPPDWDALSRYRSGECSPDEAARIAQWLDAHPADAEIIAELDDWVDAATSPGVNVSPQDVDSALARVKRAAHDEQGPVVRPNRPTLSPRFGRPSTPEWSSGRLAIIGLAAAAVLVLAVGLTRPASKRSDTINVAEIAEPAAGQSVTTAVGQMDSVRLPDGTNVLMAPGSRLTIAANFEDSREVILTGAAQFAVVHDSAHPFTVRAGDAIVRDIGTVFSVRTDGIAGAVAGVVVTEGVVELRGANADNAVTLEAGQRGSLAVDGRALIASDPADGGADDDTWIDGRLDYRAAPLALVQADFQRWYGLALRLDPSLRDRRITAEFTDETPDRVAQLIALALGADVQRTGDTIFVRQGIPKR